MSDTTVSQKVITWEHIGSGDRVDLCKKHSEELSGAYRVHKGLHRVEWHFRGGEDEATPCVECP